MADVEVKAIESVQNSGNPVLDSLVNIVRSKHMNLDPETLGKLHETLLGLARKEPGGLRRDDAVVKQSGA